jgi:hypothetical protein
LKNVEEAARDSLKSIVLFFLGIKPDYFTAVRVAYVSLALPSG